MNDTDPSDGILYRTILDDPEALEAEVGRYRDWLVEQARGLDTAMSPGVTATWGAFNVATFSSLDAAVVAGLETAARQSAAIGAYRELLGALALSHGIQNMPPVGEPLAGSEDDALRWWLELVTEVADAVLGEVLDDDDRIR